MKTVKKTIKLFIDLMPLANSEQEPIGLATLASSAYTCVEGYNRFKVSFEIDCPLMGEEVDLGAVSAETEAVEALDDEADEA